MAAVTLTADGCVNNNKFIPRRELCVKTHYISNLWKASNYDVHRTLENGFQVRVKNSDFVCPWELLNTRQIRAKNTSTHSESIKFLLTMVKGKRNSITFTVKSNSADFRRCHCHIEKRTLLQCSANGVRKPSVLHARNIHRIIRRSNTLNKTCQLRRFAYLKVNFLVALVFTLRFI